VSPQLLKSLNDTPFEIYAVDASTRSMRPATASESREYSRAINARNIVSSSTTDLLDPGRVWVPEANGREVSFERRSRGDATVSDKLKGHALIYAVTKDGSILRQVSPSLDYSYDSCSYSGAAKRFACVRQNPQHPPEIVTFGADGSNEQVLTDLNPETRGWKMPTAELVQWTDSWGNPGFGYLYRPADRAVGPQPTLVLPYDDATYDWMLTAVEMNEYPTYAFIARGYIVLRPDTRLYAAPMLPPTYKASDKLRMNEGTLSTIVAGVNKLVSMGITDPQRVGIAGLSQGSKHASYAIAHSRVFSAASVPTTVPSPMNSAGAYYASSLRLRDLNNYDDAGHVADGIERAREEESQITLWADSVTAPLLIDANEREWMWNVQAAIALKTRHKPVDMVVFPDAVHFKKWPRQLKSAWELNLDWFDYWLRDMRDPAPEKKEQYIRWDDLKSSSTLYRRMP
jgi:dipeptidyl aminopeptidase/acylaminoacyl peptidase